MTGDVRTLVTGFPSFLARHVVRRLLAEEPEGHVVVLVDEAHEARAAAQRAALGDDAARVELLLGAPDRIDLGLSGAEHARLVDGLRRVHHCFAITAAERRGDEAAARNVDAARELLELFDAAPTIERIVAWSTVHVSGKRRGRVLEEALDGAAGFRSAIEASRHEAETILRRATPQVPLTVVRPGVLVGDSSTGELDPTEGAYFLFLLLLLAPPDVRLPLPGHGEAPLHLVPVDWVARAGVALGRHPAARGGTFHLVDPRPPSARRAYELIAAAAGRPPPRGFVPAALATALLRNPALDRHARPGRGFLEQLSADVAYDDAKARALLEPAGLACPAFASYVDAVVRHVRRHEAGGAEA